MGKKRIVKKTGGSVNKGLRSRSLSNAPKKKMLTGTLYVHATYNNTKVLLADSEGNTVMWSSSGSLGFAGAKKGTPFAAAKMRRLRHYAPLPATGLRSVLFDENRLDRSIGPRHNP